MRLLHFELKQREPDLIIGPENDPQTHRWHLKHWRGIQFSLHKWYRSDHDRALHDHKADNISIILWGCYREWFSHSWERPRWRLRLPFIPYYRRAETPHRVELFNRKVRCEDLPEPPESCRGRRDIPHYHERPRIVWSIWIRFAERRPWGFWCRKGWVPWKEYVSEREYSTDGKSGGKTSTIGKGCDE